VPHHVATISVCTLTTESITLPDYRITPTDWDVERQQWEDMAHRGEVRDLDTDEIKALKATLRAHMKTTITNLDHIIDIRKNIAI